MEYETPEDVGASKEIKELDPITLEQTCIVSSVFFNDYKTPGSEGNLRGKEAIESLARVAEKVVKPLL